MKLIVVAYHYFSENEDNLSQLYPISIKRFINQIDTLGSHFEFIAKSQLVSACEGKTPLPDMSCLLTFDDGLKSQFEIAWPILKGKGIPGIFFPNTEPIIDKKVSVTHKMHYLRKKIDFSAFRTEIFRYMEKNFVEYIKIDDSLIKEKAIAQYPYDKTKVAVFKYYLNFVIDQNQLDSAVDYIFSKYAKSEELICKDYYFTKENCKELSTKDCLGTHGHQHISFEKRSIKELETDLEKSIKYLKSNGNGAIDAISYPFGGKMFESDSARKVLENSGIKVGFVNTKEINTNLENNFFLSRFNTNDVPGGNNPIISL